MKRKEVLKGIKSFIEETGAKQMEDWMLNDAVIIVKRASEWKETDNEIWTLEENKSFPREIACRLCGEGVQMSNDMYDKYQEKLFEKSQVMCLTCVLDEARKISKEMILNEMQPSEECIRKAAREAAEDQNKMVEEARKISNE